jgi:hypothetical protein
MYKGFYAIGEYITTVSQQWHGKRIPVETITYVTIDLETGCFLCGPCRDVMSRTV